MPVSISTSRFTSADWRLLQSFGDGQVLAHLDGLDVLQDLLAAAERCRCCGSPRRSPVAPFARADAARVDAVTQAALERLALEAVHHGFNGVGLEGLNFESKFHGASRST